MANNEILAESDIKLDVKMFKISYGNELTASKSICKLLKVMIKLYILIIEYGQVIFLFR